jgi:hypothetical protein
MKDASSFMSASRDQIEAFSVEERAGREACAPYAAI